MCSLSGSQPSVNAPGPSIHASSCECASTFVLPVAGSSNSTQRSLLSVEKPSSAACLPSSDHCKPANSTSRSRVCACSVCVRGGGWPCCVCCPCCVVCCCCPVCGTTPRSRCACSVAFASVRVCTCGATSMR